MCLEPLTVNVEQDGKFVPSNITTRETFSLTEIDGPLNIKDGKMVFSEKDGIDFAPTTAQIKEGAERFPFLFTVKELQATGQGDTFKEGFKFGGPFSVPSYRTQDFLDPKGRGTGRGYDYAVGLQATVNGEKDDQKTFKNNTKNYDPLPGNIDFVVDKVDKDAGEIGGTFVSIQPSDTDMGSREAVNIQINGKFFAKVADGDAKATKRYQGIDKGTYKEPKAKMGDSKLMYAPDPKK